MFYLKIGLGFRGPSSYMGQPKKQVNCMAKSPLKCWSATLFPHALKVQLDLEPLYIENPKPYSPLNPTPQTLNPRPETLDAKTPLTLNPEP